MIVLAHVFYWLSLALGALALCAFVVMLVQQSRR